jgi:anti-anti-sigma factor
MKRVGGAEPLEGNLRITFEPEAAESLLQRLTRELQKAEVAELTIDMGQVTYIAPGALQVLAAAAECARGAGKAIFLAGVGNNVYKALQLAKLAALFKRMD